MTTRMLIGIAGGSASGKSTLAKALSAAIQDQLGIPAMLLATDPYMRRENGQGPTFFFKAGGVEMFNANHPESVDWGRLLRDLDALLEQDGGPTVIVVEGLMVLHEPRVRERLGLRLFVELDADERALRRLLRDMQGGRANRDPAFIANYYRESARVGHLHYVEPSRVHADLILRGDAAWDRVRPLLLAVVEAWLRDAPAGDQAAE